MMGYKNIRVKDVYRCCSVCKNMPPPIYMNTKVRYFHSTPSVRKSVQALNLVRNIGVLAHIDAGKTTTTERMLYYSGTIHHMGEVHRGNTTTDYMDQERDRGITITSASVAIPWLKHRVNIIDTPGHIDFTMQVEQSLSVIDGAIIILDGTAGVEPQTVTVWDQSDRYSIPRVVYVNKMDRPGASFTFCLDSLKSKFNVVTLPLQLPLQDDSKGIKAIIDLLTCELLSWHGEQGEHIKRNPVTVNDIALWENMQKHRNLLIDKLADMDDKFADMVISVDKTENISVDNIRRVLNRVTKEQKAVPVLCGSSYKNIGVQPLMDAVVHYLPSPIMRDDLKIYIDSFGEHLSAKAFKVSHDKQKGPITFFRLYTGTINKGQRIYNMSKDVNEQVQRVIEANADDYEEVPAMSALDSISAVSGLKHTVIGDVITSSLSHSKTAVTILSTKQKISKDESYKLLCAKPRVPQPVFFCTIEPSSQAYLAALDNALEQIQREDPSLVIRQNTETSQTELGGMGELHLEIIKDRIMSEYKVDVYLGPIQIAYKEEIASKATYTHSVDMVIGPSKQHVSITMTAIPNDDETGELLIKDTSNPDSASNMSLVTIKKMNLIKRGVENALMRGPKVGCPVINARFIIHWLELSRNTADSVLTSAASQCVQKLLSMTGSRLMEPIAKVEVITDENKMHSVMVDMTRRRAEIKEFSVRGNNKVLLAFVPMGELLGYAKDVRVLTSGSVSFSVEFLEYREVAGQNENEAIKNITGFYP